MRTIRLSQKRTSVGVPTSGLAHHTMKHTIEALAYWNCTQRVFFTIVPDKSGYSHERVNTIRFMESICFVFVQQYISTEILGPVLLVIQQLQPVDTQCAQYN